MFKGPSGNGKTFFATAFGVQACRQFNKVEYKRLPHLVEEFKLAKYQADGIYLRLMKKLVKIDLLILDEWLLYPLENEEAAILLEIINARHEAQKSNIYCSQLNISGWYENLGNDTVAEAIMERIIHNAYDIELDGKMSMREKLSFKQTER
ncbi:ATP-binding protein [Halolactibacillus alkaliphilus]|uniref:ATP-binding protein n=1 Tax=Halolactibacillus alkaliphilus TaxID=442899 RepID=UPI001E2CAB97|nr:ATP-binding protein [Halolactibacillus alkaliphilus]